MYGSGSEQSYSPSPFQPSPSPTGYQGNFSAPSWSLIEEYNFSDFQNANSLDSQDLARRMEPRPALLGTRRRPALRDPTALRRPSVATAPWHPAAVGQPRLTRPTRLAPRWTRHLSRSGAPRTSRSASGTPTTTRGSVARLESSEEYRWVILVRCTEAKREARGAREALRHCWTLADFATPFSFSLQGGQCAVFLPDEDRTVNILQEHLEPVVPQQGDQVKVILGEDRESMGQLLSIDNQEGVVELNAGEVKMLQLRYLCRLGTGH